MLALVESYSLCKIGHLLIECVGPAIIASHIAPEVANQKVRQIFGGLLSRNRLAKVRSQALVILLHFLATHPIQVGTA